MPSGLTLCTFTDSLTGAFERLGLINMLEGIIIDLGAPFFASLSTGIGIETSRGVYLRAGCLKDTLFCCLA